MVDFSFVTVAKGRYETFAKSCESIWSLANDPNRIEHIIMYDYGDSEMEDFISNYKKEYKFKKIKGVEVKLEDYAHRNMHRDYWNPGAKLCKGEIVFGLCNDTIMVTKDYDKIMLDAFYDFKAKFRHGVFQFLVDDDSGKIEEYPKNWFCSWIILTQDAIKVMDGLAPKELPFQGADRAVYQIFNNTILPSQIHLRDTIKTLHVSHYTGRAEVDEITKHRPVNFNRPCVLNQKEMTGYINTANKLILGIS